MHRLTCYDWSIKFNYDVVDEWVDNSVGNSDAVDWRVNGSVWKYDAVDLRVGECGEG